jgi:NDP-sugar pyrophosphorylase family protein
MKALVLAAGRGIRLRPLTDRLPKPLIEVAGRPVLEHILRGLAAAGVDEAAVVIGHLGEQIEAHFGKGSSLGMRLRYRRQSSLSGTAKAALLADDLLAGEPFVLTWGDILTDWTNYRRLLEAFSADPCDALLGLNEVEDPAAGAAVYRDGDRVTEIVEKPPPGTSTTRWNNAGVMALTPVIWPILNQLEPSARGEYELPQGVRAMIEQGYRVCGLEFEGFWSDVGRPEDVALLNDLHAQGRLSDELRLTPA